MNNILALDLGTSSCKGTIYQIDGSHLAEAEQAYPVNRPRPLWVEQDPMEWWNSTVIVCRELLETVPAETIIGVGLSGQVPTMVAVDCNGNPLGPAILWQDRRAQAEADWLRKNVGEEQLRDWLGIDLPIDAGWPPARLLWLQRHQTNSINEAKCILMTKDFVLHKLTGEFCSDAWSSKGLAHLISGEAKSDYYRTLGINKSLAPVILPPYAVAGNIIQEAAKLTGLKVGTPVVTGSSDALCGMAGTGVLKSTNLAFNITGTSEMTGCAGGEPTVGVLYVPRTITDSVAILYGPTQSGGDSLLWFREWIGIASYDDIVSLAESVPAGADGVIFLPYLQGERAPIWDPVARGTLIGMLRQHGPGHGVRAVLEGVAMSVRHVLDVCGAYSKSISALRLTGGGTRIELWNQIRADVTGIKVEVTEQTNATTLGAAMLAAVGVGFYNDLRSAGSMARVKVTYFPTLELGDRYNKLYEMYREIYPLLSHFFGKLGSFSAGGNL